MEPCEPRGQFPQCVLDLTKKLLLGSKPIDTPMDCTVMLDAILKKVLVATVT